MKNSLNLVNMIYRTGIKITEDKTKSC